jgi:hypothetical protein
MAQVEYVGYGQTVVYNTTLGLEGLQKVALSETGGPATEQLDSTTSADTAYTTTADPYGSKGGPKVTLTATLQDSFASFADTKAVALALNTKAALIWCTAPATTTSNQYDHTALELTSRTTEITWTEPYASCVLVFEGTALGAWSGPA